MMTSRSWSESARYVIPGAAVTTLLLVTGRRRAGWFALAATGLLALFFRDPDRRLEADSATVYAAADGLITAIEEPVADEWMPDGQCLRITTFLNLHNVHVNRSPVAGEVTRIESIEGGFAPALFRGAGDNSRRRSAIDGPAGRVVVIQVAGMLARKISGWVRTGDLVAAGQRIGMIHLGSRTDVLLPVSSVDVLVSPGQRVWAGVTPIARYRTTP